MSQPPPYDPNNPNGNDPNNPWSQPQQPQQPNYGNNPGWQQNPNPYQQNPYHQNPYQQNPYQQFPPPNPFLYNGQRDLPNAGAILVLGIVSIVLAFCYGFIGVGLGITALIMGNKAMRTYQENPSVYTSSSYNNAKAGRICAIIGLALGAIILLIFLIEILFVASYASSFRF